MAAITAQNRHRSLLVWGLVLALGICSCATTEQKKEAPSGKNIARPSGILGRSVNSRGDDFAPSNVVAAGNSSMVFTSNIDGREVMKSIAIGREYTDDTLAARIDTIQGLPPQLVRHTGTAARAYAADKSSTVFAVSAAIHTNTASFLRVAGSIHGGSDLFEERSDGSIRSIDEVNSPAWEAHPAVARLGNMELMVFSSDRYATNVGFSAPFQGAKHVGKMGDTIVGNADLWLTFRRVGDSSWSAPRNLAGFGPAYNINTDSNEYSPFLYCTEFTPHLLFASNRTGSYDLYDATLEIDWNGRNVRVTSVTPMPYGAGQVNTVHSELFPFVAYPHVQARQRDLIFSSDRFSRERPDSARAAGYGGLDLYSVKVGLQCGENPPQVSKGSIRYRLVLLDRTTNDTTVRNGRIISFINGRQVMDSVAHTLDYFISADSLQIGQKVRIRSLGTSSYSAHACKEQQPILTHYASRSISRRLLRTVSRPETYLVDITTQARTVKTNHVVERRDTLAHGQSKPPLRYLKKSYRLEATADRRIVIITDSTIVVDSTPPPTNVVAQRKRTVTDSVFAFDTVYYESATRPALSSLTRAGDLTIATPSADTVVIDTIYLEPQYELAPPCVEVFQSSDSIRNVPYFQTAFWEVNTSAGYARHMVRLRGGDLRQAQWIELNYKNSYWGGDDPENISQKLRDRREEYRRKAELIDRNIDSLADRTMMMLRKYWQSDSANSDAKFVISMLAFSDFRPVKLGHYIADTAITYIATSYNDEISQINPSTRVIIRRNASLVGESNDTLSKLRAYFGYQSVYERFAKDSLLNYLRQRGLVLLPTDVADPKEYDRRIKSARVVILAEGRYVDTSVIPKNKEYGNDPDNDYRLLDWVRRVDVQVRRINYRGDSWEKPECCR